MKENILVNVKDIPRLKSFKKGIRHVIPVGQRKNQERNKGELRERENKNTEQTTPKRLENRTEITKAKSKMNSLCAHAATTTLKKKQIEATRTITDAAVLSEKDTRTRI